jgi:gliding motility-associated-like protein
MKKLFALAFMVFTVFHLNAQCDVVLSVSSQTDATCFGGTDGTIQVAATTSNLPLSFSSNGITNSTGLFTNYSAGTQQVIATDNIGCKDTIDFTIGEPDEIITDFTSTGVSCLGGNDGNAIAVPTGGTAPYTYNWSNNQSNDTIFGLSAGIYFVTVTDASGCAVVDQIEIGEPSEALSITFFISPVTCNDGANGSIIASVQGGTPSINGYAYNWQTGQSSSLITALTAGNYTLTVIDSRGCSASKTATVGEPAPMIHLTSSVATTCPSGNDGQATVFTSGGTPNPSGSYQYMWNNASNSTTNTATGLTGGQTYSVTITDANGCFSYENVSIDQPQEIENNISIENASCNGFADGTIALTTTGGTPPFQYQWEAKVTNFNHNQAFDLAMGNYAVTITDFNGCESEETATITEPSKVEVLIFTEDIICKGENTGGISAVVAGGTPWYSFIWDAKLNAHNVSMVNNVLAGNYSLTVTDSNGCENISSISIEEPAEDIENSYELEHVTCFGDRNGQAKISTTGGKYPYEYSLNGNTFSANNVLIGLSANQYIIHVRDDLGCLFKDTIEIVQPLEITLDLGEDKLLDNENKLTLLPVLANALPPITYEWITEDTTLSCFNCPVPIVEGIKQTQRYFLTITDRNGCTAEDDIFVHVDKEEVIFVATGFTPNNDGTNDVLFVQGSEGVARVVDFQVFDRFGQLVFRAMDTPANDASFGWNGFYRNSYVNSGVYGWTLIVEFEDGEQDKYRGNTTVIR